MGSSGKASALLLPRATNDQNDGADDRADDDEEQKDEEQQGSQHFRCQLTADDSDLR